VDDMAGPPISARPHTQVWVLPSSSGRAAMTQEAREGPYVELGHRQVLTLVHFSAQRKPCLTQNTPEIPRNIPKPLLSTP
jgi:hypothetical protein